MSCWAKWGDGEENNLDTCQGKGEFIPTWERLRMVLNLHLIRCCDALKFRFGTRDADLVTLVTHKCDGGH
jgi:hypothetical protein